MARRSNRRSDRCRTCGDIALINPDTFKPTGYCGACSAPAPKAAARNRRAARIADRETVTVKAKPRLGYELCDVCGTPAPRKGRRHESCADIVERGGEWPINY